ncbi:DUF445 domain-containing protein [Antrihabitans sp. YC2-6]|uniref:DUF445 domain-containing protein n=1 Tax=Antrihabitans sp. YC2-6 TaxID=2799498 RepID=UPI001F387A81|nr:DUF445 domain-containing protein [Antrihabitans sp. YC2-6]
MRVLNSFVQDLQDHWYLYASMPFIAAFIGYVTKLAAVEMMFRPLEFVGIKPFLGWQGIVPRGVERIASIAIDLLMGRILNPQEIIDRIDVDDMMVKLADPMREMVEDLTVAVFEETRPGLWDVTPPPVKTLLLDRVTDSVPAVVERMLREMREKVDDVIDIRALAINAMTRDKALTVRLFRTTGKKELRFICNVGIPFGFAIGVVQVFAYAATHSPWVLPVFGALTGLITDWLALQMIFRPAKPKRILGYTWQGVFHKRRAEVTRDYAHIVAAEILTPENMLEAMLTGPKSDQFLFLVEREVDRAVDDQAGFAKPVVKLVGGFQYQGVKRKVAAMVIERIKTRGVELSGLAGGTVDLPSFLEEKMVTMTNEEYEDLLRPAFKQDEWKIIVVGAVLGFLVGELQLHLVLGA